MKIVKKISVFVLVLLYIFAFSFSLRKASADTIITSNKISIQGAEIRKTGEKQGLRFVGTIDDSFETEYDDVVGYGILVAYGNVAGANIYHGQNPNGKRLGEYYADKANLDRDDSDNPCIKYTIYNIPDSEISTTLSARMYAKLSDGTYIYSEGGKQRNVEDVARRAYSEGERSTLINNIASKGKIRVIHSDGTKNYYESISEITLLAGDKLSFLAGTYEEAIEVSVNNVEINGVYTGILCDSSSRLDEAETVFNQSIKVKNGVDGFTVNGVKSTANKAIILEDSQENVAIKYSKLNSAFGVSDAKNAINTYGELRHDNVLIQKNDFNGQSDTENRLVYFQGYVNGFTVDANSFSSVVTSEIKANEYGVKLNRIANDSIVSIVNNQFNQRYANYQIDLATSHSAENYLSATINIENNKGIGSSDGAEFYGNGFRILYIGSSSIINMLHNTNFRFSRYYNTIIFSEAQGTGSTDINPGTQDPTINIKYNILYGDKNVNVANPGRGTTLNTNYLNLGLGFKVDASKITVDYNYFSGTARGYSFKTNSASSSSKNIYGTGAISQTNVCANASEANAAYAAYLAG